MKYVFLFLFASFAMPCFAQDQNPDYQAALTFRENNENEKAMAAVEKAIRSDSTQVRFLNLKADLLRRMKRLQESYQLYSKSISMKPDDVQAFNERGLLLYGAMQFDEAIRDFSDGLSYATSDTNRHLLLVNRAAAKIGKRQFMDAYEDLMTVYKVDSNDLGMLVNLSTICDEIGKGDETLRILERVIKLDPKNVAAYGNIGFKYQEMGDHQTAIRYFNKVIEMDPNEPLGYSNRSFNKLKLGDLAGAMADIEKSLSIYPGNSYAYRIRALIYIQQKDFRKACKDLDTALERGFAEMYGEEVQQLKAQHCGR